MILLCIMEKQIVLNDDDFLWVSSLNIGFLAIEHPGNQKVVQTHTILYGHRLWSVCQTVVQFHFKIRQNRKVYSNFK